MGTDRHSVAASNHSIGLIAAVGCFGIGECSEREIVRASVEIGGGLAMRLAQVSLKRGEEIDVVSSSFVLFCFQIKILAERFDFRFRRRILGNFRLCYERIGEWSGGA